MDSPFGTQSTCGREGTTCGHRCLATGFSRSSQRYRRRSDPQMALRMWLKALAAAQIRYGYQRLHILLRREGCDVNDP